MKKLLQLSLALGLILFLSFSTVNAQSFQNRTACPMEMAVAWSVGACAPGGSFSTIVPPMTEIFFPMPPGATVDAAKGVYVGSSCVFYVGVPCSGYPLTTVVPCGVACGTYNAGLFGQTVVAWP